MPRRHLENIARTARPAGSAAESAARAYCAAELATLGLTVREERFAFSRFPGAWATPVGGVAACLTIAAAASCGAARLPGVALGVLVASAAIGIPLAVWIASRGVLELPWLRATGINLVAVRGEPAVWLVAHLDSKSQPVPMLARVAGIVGSALVLAVLLALGVAAWSGENAPPAVWIAAGLAGIIATLPVMGSTVASRSPGAVDDASGVATVLRAAALLPRTMRVGVALTSAEELGMAGAQAFATCRGAGVALNVDGVDDRGTVLCMVHGRAPIARDAVLAAARRIGAAVRLGPTIPGILTDGVALANAGWSAVTFSRGSFATLARIHRAADNLDALRGDGVESMARLVAAAATEMT